MLPVSLHQSLFVCFYLVLIKSELSFARFMHPAKEGMKWVDDSSFISLFLKGIPLLDIMWRGVFLKPTHLVLFSLRKWLHFPRVFLIGVRLHIKQWISEWYIVMLTLLMLQLLS